MAKFTAYKVLELPSSGIDENGLYFVKGSGDDRFTAHLRGSGDWIDLGEVEDVDTVNGLTGDVKVDLTFTSGVLELTATGDGTAAPTASITIIDDSGQGTNKTYSSTKINDLLSSSGYGDMLKSQYDPTGVEGDVFDYGNLHGTPDINDSTVKLTDGSTDLGEFTLNQSSNESIDLSPLKVTVTDGLTSSSTSNALSANQGRVLKGLIDDLSDIVQSGLSLQDGFDPSTETNFPGGGDAEKGFVWFSTDTGTVQGVVLEPGDMLIAKVDDASETDEEDWIFIQANIGQATETVSGYARLATTAEAEAGSDDSTIMTPAKVKSAIEEISQTLVESTSISITSGQIRTKAISGDVVISANGVTSTISNGAVTFAKMQNIGSEVLLGRHAASSGVAQEISLGDNLEFESGSLQVAWGSNEW